jgi:hypothetical protein
VKSALAIVILFGCSSNETTTPTSMDATTETAQDSAAEVVADVVNDTASCKLLKPFSSKNVACNECAQAKCCVEINGCLADKRCDDDYVNCSLACALLPADAGDAGAEKERCLNECNTMYPEGRKLYDAAFGCTDSKCAAECG